MQLGAQSYPLSLKVRVGSGRIFSYGDCLSLPGRILPFNFPRNPGLVDLNEQYRRLGFAGRIRAYNGVVRVGERLGSPIMRALIMPLRRHFIDVIGDNFEDKNRALLAGLLLGEKALLPEATREAFGNAGISHILVVSGLTVSILIGVCILLFSVLGVRDLKALLLIVAVTLLYVGIAGFPAPALRAGFMAIMAGIGLFIERRYDPLNGIFIAAIVILMITPSALLDARFHLSFAATLGIVLGFDQLKGLAGKLQDRRRLDHWVLSPLAVTVAATLGTLPLIAYYFHRVSLVSLLANLIVVPLVAVAVPLGMLMMAVSPLSHALAAILGQSLNLVLSAILWLGETLGSFRWSAVITGQPSILLVLWLYALLLLLAGFRRVWMRKAFLFTALAGLSVIVWSQAFTRPALRVTFLDAGQGTATYLEFPNGRKMLVDAGEARTQIVGDFLRSRGVNRVDLLAITHPDRHVYTPVQELLGRVRFDHVLVPTDSTDDPTYNSLLRTLGNSGARIHVVSRDDTIKGLGAECVALSPAALYRPFLLDRSLSPNDVSLVLRVEYNGYSMLLPGDLDQTGLMGNEPARADLLLASHRGGTRANSDAFLDLVQPRVAVVPGTARLRPGLTQRLAERDITVYNLRRDGAAELVVDAHGAHIRQPFLNPSVASQDS